MFNMAAMLPDLAAFDVNCEPTSLGITWKKWVSRFENLFVALDIKDENRKRALLLITEESNLVTSLKL